MAKMVPYIVKRAGTLNRYLRVFAEVIKEGVVKVDVPSIGTSSGCLVTSKLQGKSTTRNSFLKKQCCIR